MGRGSLRAALIAACAAASAGFLVALAIPASAAPYEDAVRLDAAGAYSVLAGSTVTNTGPTVLSGSLGVSPGTAITGFPPGTAGGATNAGDAGAASGQSSLTAAYLDAESRPATGTSLGVSLVGGIHQPGVYNASSSLDVSGAVTLDGLGDPNAVFIFQVGASMTTASSTSIVLIGNAQACNVFWQIGASATLGTNTAFIGTVMALTSITVTTGTTVQGRALARNGAVTLDNNVFTSAACSTTATTTAVTATPAQAGGTTTATATVTAPGAATPTGTVSFTADGAPAGTATIDANGQASITLPVGTGPQITLVAHYNGLGSYGESTSAPTPLLITQPAPVPSATASVSAASPVAAAPQVSPPTTTSPALAATGASHLPALTAAAAAIVLTGLALTWTAGRTSRRRTPGASRSSE